MRNWNGEMRNRRTASVQKMPGGFTDAKAAGNRSAVMASQEQMRNWDGGEYDSTYYLFSGRIAVRAVSDSLYLWKNKRDRHQGKGKRECRYNQYAADFRREGGGTGAVWGYPEVCHSMSCRAFYHCAVSGAGYQLSACFICGGRGNLRA